METNKIKERVDRYLQLLDGIRQEVGGEQAALVLLQEVTKDMRMDRIRDERNPNRNAVPANAPVNAPGNANEAPATERQLAYLEKLGVTPPAGLTKKEASVLIDEALAKEFEPAQPSLEWNLRHPPASA